MLEILYFELFYVISHGRSQQLLVWGLHEIWITIRLGIGEIDTLKGTHYVLKRFVDRAWMSWMNTDLLSIYILGYFHIRIQISLIQKLNSFIGLYLGSTCKRSFRLPKTKSSFSKISKYMNINYSQVTAPSIDEALQNVVSFVDLCILIWHQITKVSKMETQTRLVTACFFGYSFVRTIPKVLLWMAVEDMVSGTLIQSSLPLFIYSCGDIIFRVSATVIFKKTSFLPLVIVLGFVTVLAYVLLVAVDQVNLRLAGAFFIGGECSLATVIIIFLMARFTKIEEISSAFEVGINSVAVVCALLYTGKLFLYLRIIG